MTIKTIIALAVVSAIIGCTSGNRPADRKPEFSTGEGAISGKLVGTDSSPFDVSLAGGARSLRIELLSPARGIAATTYPQNEKPGFVFSHVQPGRYEVSVYAVVMGKRTIAGSLPVVVNPEQVTPATVTMTVTQQGER